jgi:hypothetical protein
MPNTIGSPRFEIACVLVCLDHVARFVKNADHHIMSAAVKLCVTDCIRLAISQATEGQRPGNQIDAALVVARVDSV